MIVCKTTNDSKDNGVPTLLNHIQECQVFKSKSEKNKICKGTELYQMAHKQKTRRLKRSAKQLDKQNEELLRILCGSTYGRWGPQDFPCSYPKRGVNLVIFYTPMESLCGKSFLLMKKSHKLTHRKYKSYVKNLFLIKNCLQKYKNKY